MCKHKNAMQKAMGYFTSKQKRVNLQAVQLKPLNSAEKKYCRNEGAGGVNKITRQAQICLWNMNKASFSQCIDHSHFSAYKS
jgi:hypothetical protein